jgi:UDP-galactopyranose mutase
MINDYLIVGAGLTGSVIARELTNQGYKVLVIDKRNHVAGNCYDDVFDNFYVCKFGGHIFHTNSDNIWKYVNKYSNFYQYNHRIVASHKEKLYLFPINLWTFYQMGFPHTPEEAKDYLSKVRLKIDNPKNLEEKLLGMIGEELYYTFYYGYTKKQWNKEPKELPASIINRIPIRFNFDNCYYNDKYQGIPVNGYTNLVKKILSGIPLELNIDFLENKELENCTKKIIYTGEIDKYYSYIFGNLEYRSLKFDYMCDINLGTPTINYTEYEVPYTRQVAHDYFYPNAISHIISEEYPSDNGEPYYPVPSNNNLELYKKYSKIKNDNVIFAGRLGSYLYLNMDQAIGQGLNIAKKILESR